MNKELYEEVREWVKGKWDGTEEYCILGALPQYMREKIKRLCDFAESADKVAMEKIKELEELKETVKVFIDKHMAYPYDDEGNSMDCDYTKDYERLLSLCKGSEER